MTDPSEAHDSAARVDESTAQQEGILFRRRGDPGHVWPIGPVAKSVTSALEGVISTGNSQTILLWPQGPDSVAVFHAFVALNRLEQGVHSNLGSLFFPWNRNTPGIQNTLLVDRDFLDRAALGAINRLAARSSGPSLAYVMALHSLKHLMKSGKASKGLARALREDPALIYPSLFEVSPQLGIYKAEVRGYEGHFLRRLRRHTWISDRHDHVDAATGPLTAPFFMFGVHAEAAKVSILRQAGLDPKRGGRAPDVVLLDATRRARERLDGWKQIVPGFLSILSDLYGPESPPLLAITDDCFALESLRWEIVKRYEVRRKRIVSKDARPSSALAILSSSPDPLDQRVIAGAPATSIQFDVYGSDVLSLVDSGLKLRRLFINSDDSDNATLVTKTIAIAQTLVGLPGSSRQLHDFLTANYQGYDLMTKGARFDHQAPIVAMRAAMEKGLSGPLHSALTKFLSSFESVCRAADANSSSRRLFDQWIRRLAARDGKTIVVCSSDFLRAFIAWRFETDPDFGDVRAQLDSQIVLADRRDATESFGQSAQIAPISRLFFVEPTADDLLHVMLAPMVPGEIIVLSNLARAEQIIRRVHILQKLEGTEPIRPLLASVETELVRVLGGRSSEIPDLETDITLPRADTIDLTESGSISFGQRRILETSSGLRIRAFDGTELAYYEADSLQAFSKRTAKELSPGDQICVFSQDFVAAARERLSFTADAPEILAEYHKTVAVAVERLPGKDIASRIVSLRARMLALDASLDMPSDQAMRYWINIAHLGEVPRDQVKPQAPRDLRHFLCFMKALNISEDISRYYWNFGVFWTRSMRISKGSWFHQLFLGILVDPHGTASRLPEARQSEAWRIYETAEQYLVTIATNEVEQAT